MEEKTTTEKLNEILKKTKLDDLNAYFEHNQEKLAEEQQPFATYMRARFREKKVRQQDVFLAADISEGYGYKLVSEEKRTRQRDVILRICLAARFDLQETQKALRLYGMSPLYPKVARDCVFIIAFNQGISDVHEVDRMLAAYGFEALYSCISTE